MENDTTTRSVDWSGAVDAIYRLYTTSTVFNSTYRTGWAVTKSQQDDFTSVPIVFETEPLLSYHNNYYDILVYLSKSSPTMCKICTMFDNKIISVDIELIESHLNTSDISKLKIFIDKKIKDKTSMDRW